MDEFELYGEISGPVVGVGGEARNITTVDKGLKRVPMTKNFHPQELKGEVQVAFFVYERMKSVHTKQTNFVGLKIGGRVGLILGANGEAKIGLGW